MQEEVSFNETFRRLKVKEQSTQEKAQIWEGGLVLNQTPAILKAI